MSAVWLILCAGVGVDAGWQRLADGGYEYIIQIEPHMLDSLNQQKHDIVSEVPPFLRDIRSYRIRVGDEELPRDAPAPGAPSSLAESRASAATKPPKLGAAHLPENDGPAMTAPPAPAPVSVNPGVAGDASVNEAGNSDPSTTDSTPEGTAASNVPPEQVVAFRNPPESPRTQNPTTTQGGNAHPLFGTLQARVLPLAQSHTWLIPAVLAGLLFSLGLNFFLTWVSWGERSRYRALLRGLKRDSASV